MWQPCCPIITWLSNNCVLREKIQYRCQYYNYWYFTLTGYYRSAWGEGLFYGQIGDLPPRRAYPDWYRCGVEIPGNRQVVTMDRDSKYHGRNRVCQRISWTSRCEWDGGHNACRLRVNELHFRPIKPNNHFLLYFACSFHTHANFFLPRKTK